MRKVKKGPGIIFYICVVYIPLVLIAFLLNQRVHSYERQNELKPVWDFISVENLTFVFSQLFTCVYMNMSCGEMKLKPVWISYRSFYRHGIFIWAVFTRAKWISTISLDIALDAHVRLKFITGMDFISVISTEKKYVYITKNII